MNNREQYKRIVYFFSTLIIVALLTLEFAFTWYTAYSDVIALPFYRRGNWVLVLIYAVLFLIILKASGGYKVGYLKRGDMLYSQILSLGFVNAITYFQISLIGRHLMPVKPLLWMTLIDLVLLICWAVLSNRFYFWLYPPRRLIIVYGSQSAAQLVMKMSERVDKYMICESISIEAGLDRIKQEMRRFEGVIICDIAGAERNDLVKYCFETSTRAYIAPKISDIILRGAEDIRLFDSPLLLCRNYGLTFEQRLAKRTFDICASLMGLILLSPVMLVCAILVKATSEGPVIFKQERVGLHNKVFKMYKFRTMEVQKQSAEENAWTVKNDPRVTKVGKFMRKTSLDELPQLFNILMGEMSLVGPRPERPQWVDKYKEEIPRYMIKHQVRPGLTGWAQVNGYRGDTSIRKRIEYDLFYIENWSLALDIKILFMTIFKGFVNKNAY